jgi:hypothetical protein
MSRIPAPMKPITTLRIPDELRRWLVQTSIATGVPMNTILVRLIAEAAKKEKSHGKRSR